jgi:branched-chain amino acid aminotransferase
MEPYAFYKGEFMPLSEARMGVLTQSLHYGTACFGGIRGNWDSEQERFCLFRLQDHYDRLLYGCRILKIDLPYSHQDMCQSTIELVKRSGYRQNVYLRPLAYKSSEAIGVKVHGLENDFLIIVTTLPPYLDTSQGVRCCVSSWHRVDDSMIPTKCKISGAYANSALAKTEAIENGFDEAILLTQDGHVSEGSGENIFIVINGTLITPPASDNILMGFTRDAVIKLAKNELGIDTVERSVSRSELYYAQECFLTGTATSIAQVVEIDRRPIGSGQTGKITAKLQEIFAEVALGNNPRYSDWYTLVRPTGTQKT